MWVEDGPVLPDSEVAARTHLLEDCRSAASVLGLRLHLLELSLKLQDVVVLRLLVLGDLRRGGAVGLDLRCRAALLRAGLQEVDAGALVDYMAK